MQRVRVGCVLFLLVYSNPAAAIINAVPTGPEFGVNTTTAGGQTSRGLAGGVDGNFVVAFSSPDGNGYGVLAQRFAPDGTPLGTEFQVNQDTSAYLQLPGGAAADTDGNFVIVWQSPDGSSYGVFARRFAADGTPLGSEFLINSTTAGNQAPAGVAANADGDFVAVWVGSDGSGEGVFARRFDSAGVAAGTEFQVNTYTTSLQVPDAVAMDRDGAFVVVWASTQDGNGFGAFARHYDSTGAPLGTEFQVATNTTGNQIAGGVAMDADGGFVIVWQSDAYGIDDEVFARRYDSNGSSLGTEFQVNSYTTNDQRIPTVAMDATGAFVVAWVSYFQDGFGYGIFGQRFDSGGTPVGTEFAVNTYTTGNQEVVQAYAAGPGDFVVVWTGPETGLGAGSGVRARIYDEPSCPSAPLTGCNTAAKQLLLIKDDAADDGKDKLLWKWLKGATTRDEFGEPPTATEYALCIYAGTAVYDVVVPGGGTCGNNACWKETTAGYSYTDPAAAHDGIRKILLKSGIEGKVLVKGKGGGLALPADLLPFDEPLNLQAQLVNSRGKCWDVVLTGTPKINSDTVFKAKSP